MTGLILWTVSKPITMFFWFKWISSIKRWDEFIAENNLKIKKSDDLIYIEELYKFNKKFKKADFYEDINIILEKKLKELKVEDIKSDVWIIKKKDDIYELLEDIKLFCNKLTKEELNAVINNKETSS